ncbi:hypothetical protein DFQ28_009087 [Apophysomyces sp. BC1034]|nr:hypothetical protein DFQ30_008831 [Apophysomyces sp. BC1015]KAG0173776.1 hypothetical protein DFQ29_007765 [Apophysomyces sp. BC1021]KAG0185612.1 hypothetical protein DFQ28_009087 [Apophysomyces sp. BC1034]
MSNVASPHSVPENEQPANHPMSFSGLKIDEVIAELKDQLDNKELLLSNMNSNGISRNALLKQTAEIRQRIHDLNQMDNEDELSTADRRRLENLANEFHFVKNVGQSANEMALPLLPPPNTSFSVKQRGKSTHVRKNTDIKFATEIGQGLLIEVRKLQAALQEKEESIQQLEITNADRERDHELMLKHLRLRNDAEEKLKEDNWNLEVANQELRTRLVDTSQANTKLGADHAKVAKQLQTSLEQIEILKTQEEKARSAIETIKIRHEQDAQTLRRNIGALQRTNAQTQKQMDALNTELKICKAKLAVKMAANSRQHASPDEANATTADDRNDPEGLLSSSLTPPVSPNPPVRSQALESETLKQSLAHAHRIISNLRSSLHKEKVEKFEIKKVLSDSQETIEQMRKEQISWGSGGNGGTSRKTASSGRKKVGKKRVGVSRQPRGVTGNSNAFTTDEETPDVSDAEKTDSEQSLDGINESMWTNGNLATFDTNGTGMKSLSSELGNFDGKMGVETVDAAVNTEPIVSIGLQESDKKLTVSQEATLSESCTPSAIGVQEEETMGITSTNALPRRVHLSYATTPSISQSPTTQKEFVHEMNTVVTAPEHTRKNVVNVSDEKQQSAPDTLIEQVRNSLVSVVNISDSQQPSNDIIPVHRPESVHLSVEETECVLQNTVQDQEVADLAVPKPGSLKKEPDLLAGTIVVKNEQSKRYSSISPINGVSAGTSTYAIQDHKQTEPVALNDSLSAETSMHAIQNHEQIKSVAPEETLMRSDPPREQVLPSRIDCDDERDLIMADADQSQETSLSFVDVKHEEFKPVATASPLPASDQPKIFSSTTLEPISYSPRDSYRSTSSLKVNQFTEMAIPALSIAPWNETHKKRNSTLILQSTENSAVYPMDTSTVNNGMQTLLLDEARKKRNSTFISQSTENTVVYSTDAPTVNSEIQTLPLDEALEKRNSTFVMQSIGKHVVYSTDAPTVNSEIQTLPLGEAVEKRNSTFVAQSIEKHAVYPVDTPTVNSKTRTPPSGEALEKKDTTFTMQSIGKHVVYSTEAPTVNSEIQTLPLGEAVEKRNSTFATQSIERHVVYPTDAPTANSEVQARPLDEAVGKRNPTLVMRSGENSVVYPMDTCAVNSGLQTLPMGEALEKKTPTLAMQSTEKNAVYPTGTFTVNSTIPALSLQQAHEPIEVVRLRYVDEEVQCSLLPGDPIRINDANLAISNSNEKCQLTTHSLPVVEHGAQGISDVKLVVHASEPCDQFVQADETEMITRAEANALANAFAAQAVEKERTEVASRLAAKAQAQLTRQPSTQSLRPPRPSTNAPPSLIEKSLSTSRLAKLSGYVKPHPSVSTPANGNRPLRTSSSMVSLRSQSLRRDSIPRRNQREQETSSFGNVRILEQRRYGNKLSSSDTVSTHSTRSNLKSQRSTTSLSTMSSDDVIEQAAMSSDRHFMDSMDGMDMETISAITQTMIGEWLWKHTRRHVGGGISEHKHKRFVWVHPYTRTLYWGATEPGMTGNEAKAKSAFIETVSAVSSKDQTGVAPMSLLIRTTKRDLKLTASTIERHELWLKSLSYLLGRPSFPEDASSEVFDTQGSLAEEEKTRISSSLVQGSHSALGYESDESEDLLNVRQCCDGKHDLSTLSRRGSHNHNNHHHQ